MHPRTSRTLTALAAAATLVVVGGPAEANTADAPVGTTGMTTLTITGDGWGHGRGMSQWGAQGAALQGRSFEEILAFYYPGTTLSRLASGKIRVLITGDDDNNLKIAPAPRLRVNDLGNGRSYKLRKKAKAWRLKSVAGQTRVYFKTGHWHLYKTGGRNALAGDGEFQSSARRLTLKLSTGSRVYRGKLRFTNSDTVNVVGMEQYLRGVVPAEAFTSWRPAALRAQAVAARSYAAYERDANVNRYFGVYDTTRSQAYRGHAIEDPNTDAAIVATAGLFLTYGGKPAFTEFSASSGGWTATGSKPYLRAQPDVYDTAASGDPHLDWVRRQVPIAALQAAYPALGTLTSIEIVDRDGDATHPNDGWVLGIKLTGTSGTSTIKGSDLQSVYRLKSAYFSVTTP
jgi:peptidoglycan hydrolase-like amidase